MMSWNQSKQLLKLNKKKTQIKKYLNRHLTKEDAQMANKQTKRCLTLKVTKELQLKATIRCCHTTI
jgi:hypothetical protein